MTIFFVTCSPEAGETVTSDTSKMLKLAEQCLERAQSTAAKLGGCPGESFLGSPTLALAQSGSVGPLCGSMAVRVLQGKHA